MAAQQSDPLAEVRRLLQLVQTSLDDDQAVDPVVIELSGKSTIAVHLTVALLKKGFRVGTIDLDARQGTLSQYFENRLEASIAGAITRDVSLRDIEREIITPVLRNAVVVSGSAHVAVERVVRSAARRSRRARAPRARSPRAAAWGARGRPSG